MAADEKWYFTKEQLANTPSRKCGVDPDKELSYRQQAANLIQNMGQRLLVSQLCINTAIVYMHRFYMFHSLTQFHRNEVAIAALFLAAKVEEQPRKLDHVIKMGHTCLHREGQNLDLKSDIFIDQAQCLVYNENVLLLTLGFDVAIDHPHTHVVRCCHLVKASKDLAQTSYFMASNSLHLTTMCLQYKPTVVACFCIHLACKWSNMEIPQSNEGKPWFWYVDKTVTSELLAQLTGEFLHIFDKYPSRLKRKVRSISANQSPNLSHPPIANSPFDVEPRRIQSQSTSNANAIKSPTPNSNANVSTNANTNVDGIGSQSNRPSNDIDNNKKSSSAMPSRTAVDYRDYREKKERERQDRERAGANTSSVSIDTNKHHSHHQKQSSSSTSAQPNKHSSSSSNSSNKSVHHNHHHSSRQDVKSQMMPQRHSTSSQQPRDPNRDRQRISHGHSVDNSSMNNIVQETVHPPEKLSNSIHKSSHNSKPYARYSDAQSRSRKQDILEQRSEEVRKLIEKPLPIKPRAEVLKEEYAAKMLKQSHHPSKYEVAPEKSICSVNATQPTLPYVDNAKMLNVGQTAFTVAKSPNAPVSASQGSQKSLSSMKSSGQMPVKNGSSTSVTSSFSLVSSFDDLIPEKKPEHPPPPPTNKHRSLFSPEKTPTNARELSHMQRPVKKGRISPIKDVHSSYPSSNQMQTSAESLQQQGSKQKLSNSASTVPTGHKQRNHSDLVSNQLQPFKQQTQIEDSSRRYSMPTIAMHDSTPLGNNRIPELIQPIKDSPVGNKNISTPITDVKPQSQHHGLSNGLEQNIMKHEYSTIDPSSFLIKNELPEQLLSNEITTDFMFVKQDQQKLGDFLTFHEPVFETTEESVRKQESISPLKSAQGISALLQEPLAMPSLLQPPANFVQHLEDNKMLQQQHGSTEVDNILPSTVDMSDLTGPIQCTVDVPARPVTPVAALPPTPSPTPIPVASAPLNSTNAVNASEEKKSEHRSKSEKKKEKKKHKHKEKEKEKEKKDKHKHKHKDKDKEKHHRDKGDKEKKTEEDNSASVGGSASALGTVPIKITIPKDKLNLSADSIGTSSSTTSSSSLKIKIPKERLKGTEVTSHQLLSKSQQPVRPAPLKIKIRTDALARSSSDMQAPSQQESNNGASSSKKRERSDPTEGTPASKKMQQQRPNERYNGRHNPYSSYADKPDRFYEAVEVKTESGDAGEGLPRNYLPNNYDSSIYS